MLAKTDHSGNTTGLLAKRRDRAHFLNQIELRDNPIGVRAQEHIENSSELLKDGMGTSGRGRQTSNRWREMTVRRQFKRNL